MKESQKKQWLHFFLLYLITILFTVLLLFGIGAVAQHEILQDIRERELQYSLSETVGLLDDTVSRLRIIMNQVAGQSWIDSFVNETKEIAEQDPYQLYQAQNNLFLQSIAFNNVDVLGVYFKNSNLVIDNMTTYRATDYFKNVFQADGVSQTQWFAWAEGRSYFDVVSLHGAKLWERPLNGVILMKTIPGNAIKGKGMVFMLVNDRLFESLLKPLEQDGIFFALTDSENTLIASSAGFEEHWLGKSGRKRCRKRQSSISHKMAECANCGTVCRSIQIFAGPIKRGGRL